MMTLLTMLVFGPIVGLLLSAIAWCGAAWFYLDGKRSDWSDQDIGECRYYSSAVSLVMAVGLLIAGGPIPLAAGALVTVLLVIGYRYNLFTLTPTKTGRQFTEWETKWLLMTEDERLKVKQSMTKCDGIATEVASAVIELRKRKDLNSRLKTAAETLNECGVPTLWVAAVSSIVSERKQENDSLAGDLRRKMTDAQQANCELQSALDRHIESPDAVIGKLNAVIADAAKDLTQ